MDIGRKEEAEINRKQSKRGTWTKGKMRDRQKIKQKGEVDTEKEEK